MKIYRTESDYMRVGTEKKDEKYIITITKKRNILVATRGSSKPHKEEIYNTYKKEFDSAEKANRYFKGIKANHPTLTFFKEV